MHHQETVHSNNSTVDNDELIQVQRVLVDLTGEYHRAIAANNTLKSKYKQLRQRYDQKFRESREKEMTANKGTESNNELDLREGQKTPKIITALPSPSSLNHSRSLSPANGALTALKSHPQCPASSREDQSTITIKDETTNRSGVEDSIVGPESLTQSSNGPSANLKPAVSFTIIPDETLPQQSKHPKRTSNEDSDLPIIISERSLKRKRSLLAKHNHLDRIENVQIHSGSMTKPIRIKDDHSSSSPIASIAQYKSMDGHDSLDLDEVGDRRLTPRKARKLLGRPLSRSPGLDLPIDVEREDNPMDHEKENEIFDDANKLIRSHNENTGVLTIGDDKTFKKENEIHSATAMKENQHNYIVEAPEWLRNYPKAAMQYSHNQRTHERIARHENLLQFILKEDSKLMTRSKSTSPFRDATKQPREKEDQLQASAISNIIDFAAAPSKSQDGNSEEYRKCHQVLAPIDPNTHILARTSDLSRNPKHDRSSRLRDRDAVMIPAMAEDGEEFNTRSKSKISKNSSANATSNSSGLNEAAFKTPRAPNMFDRLGPLLSGPSSPKLPLQLDKPNKNLTNHATKIQTPPNSSSLRANTGSLSKPTSALNEMLDVSSVKGRLGKTSIQNSRRSKRLSSKLALTDGLPEVLPEHEPLRLRPMRSLCPEDFKLNPSRNQGFDHAYIDVVRKRDQRKCMPGCTRPGCCGAVLRKAIEVGGYTPHRKSGISGSTPEIELAEDQRLLEEYLGDNSVRLNKMSDTEKQELLLKAKTEKFANHFGKHRHVYGRGSTPPGFWDTDMPTTQQHEEYRKAARLLEMEKVEEMYKEAMRPDGRYKFRDE